MPPRRLGSDNDAYPFIICSLFKDTVGSSKLCNIKSLITVNNELEGTWKETVVA